MKDLIFDLEDNGGGYLQAAAQIANEFLQKGDLIVYTSGRTAPRQEYKAQANGRWRKGKVVVLTNRVYCFCRRDRFRSHPGSGPWRGGRSQNLRQGIGAASAYLR